MKLFEIDPIAMSNYRKKVSTGIRARIVLDIHIHPMYSLL